MSLTTQIRDQFNLFLTADDVEPITEAFQNIKNLIPQLKSLNNTTFYPTIRDAISPAVTFVLRRLFQTLDERWNFYAADRQKVLAKKNVLVSGGGPCGLRSAVELAMLGFNVTLVEKRTFFSRHNILKTWTPTVEDLISLGFKTYFPNFQIHGLHAIGTRELQICLLRTALLLGVNFIYGESTAGIIEPGFTVPGDSDPMQWRVLTNTLGLVVKPVNTNPGEVTSANENQEATETTEVNSSPRKSGVPTELAFTVGEQNADRLEKHSKVDFFEKATTKDGAILRNHSELPEEIKHVIPFDSLVVAEGESSKLIRNLGFDRYVTRFAPAIGIIVNVDFNRNNSEEKKLKEFVVYRSQADWKQTCLGKLSESGVDVENMEYMKFSTHFIVVTAKKDSLFKFGVLKENHPLISDALNKDNIDIDRLRAFARHLATAAGVPATAQLSSAHGVNIFDFSCKGRLTQPFSALKPKNITENVHHPLVLPIGDTLVNPFWPQGLGVNRGFHSSLDAAWTVFLDSIAPTSGSSSRDIALHERDVSHRMMMWFPLLPPLVNSGTQWKADPLTRYAAKIPQTMHMNDVQKHATVSSLTPRMLNVLKLKLPSAV
jgi:hypothetical protein